MFEGSFEAERKHIHVDRGGFGWEFVAVHVGADVAGVFVFAVAPFAEPDHEGVDFDADGFGAEFGGSFDDDAIAAAEVDNILIFIKWIEIGESFADVWFFAWDVRGAEDAG